MNDAVLAEKQTDAELEKRMYEPNQSFGHFTASRDAAVEALRQLLAGRISASEAALALARYDELGT